MTDKELIALYLDGSTQAFEIFYKKYKDVVLRYLVGMTRNIQVSEEICAASWECFIDRVGSIKEHPSAYLFAIVRTKTTDYFRKQSRESRYLNETNETIVDCSGTRHIECENMLKELHKLPVEQREVLLLRHLSEHSLEEIAKYQNTNRENVKSRLRYAMKKIRTLMVPTGES